MVGRTERTVINNMVLPLQEMLGNQRVKINYGNGTVTILGRDVHLFGANNEQSRTKIQGMTLAGTMVDEAGVIVESFFNMLYSRLSIPGAKLWLTANPEGPQHWLKVNWLDRAALWITKTGEITHPDVENPLQLHRYTYTLDDNPSLPHDYVERIKNSYTGVWRRRYIDSEWVAAVGAIYGMWDPAVHVIPWQDLPRIDDVISVGIDYGTSNATSAVILGLGSDSNLYVLDEWVWSGRDTQQYLTDAVLAQRVTEWMREPHTPNGGGEQRPRMICVDPSAASFRTELQVTHHMPTFEADNSVLDGIRTISSLLQERRLFVSDRCKNLINEFPSYGWDPKATERGEDKPVKVADHGVDSLRYAVLSTETYWSNRVRRNRAVA